MFVRQFLLAEVRKFVDMKSLVILALVATCGAYNLPPYIKKCNVYKDIGQCIVDQIPTIRPYLKDGIEEMNIPSLAPFRVPEIIINAGENKTITVKDVEVYHLDEVEIFVKESDIQTFYVKYNFNFKKIVIQGYNEFDRQVFVYPIEEQGPTKITIHDLDIDYSMNFKPEDRDGVNYMKLYNTKTSYKSGNFTINMNDSRNKSANHCDKINVFLHDHWNEIKEVIMPAVTQTVIHLVEKILNDIVENIPAEVLYDFSQ